MCIRDSHTSYQQAVTSTGRLSSTEPNLQNIPIKTAEGRRIREAFVPEKGNILISADYSQIELRIMAHLSDDKNLTNAFNNDIDVHSSTAAEVFGVSIEDVSQDQRRSAKAINFGLMYGMSAFGLTRQLGIPRGEAQEYLDQGFKAMKLRLGWGPTDGAEGMYKNIELIKTVRSVVGDNVDLVGELLPIVQKVHIT